MEQESIGSVLAAFQPDFRAKTGISGQLNSLLPVFHHYYSIIIYYYCNNVFIITIVTSVIRLSLLINTYVI